MKRQDRLKKIRDYLLAQKKANYTKIKNAIEIQDKELSDDLKYLIEKGEVTARKELSDRRKTWYSLKDRNVTLAESRRFEAIEFIKNLGPAMKFSQAQSKHSRLVFKATVFTNQADYPEEQLTFEARNIAEGMGRALTTFIKAKNVKIKPSFKYAAILTLETERGNKP
jgi:hypothetical protein